MKLSTLFSIGILISFFLPWIDFTFYSLSGFEIPTSLDKISNVNSVLGNKENMEILKISYFFYLIPICSIFNIIKDLSKGKYTLFLDEFFFGIIAVIAFVLFVYNLNEKSISFLSLGYYLTLIFSVLGLLAPANSNEEEKTIELVNNAKVTKEDFVGEQTILLNQLSQLHDLKEKGVITEEVYEYQRKNIFLKLKPETESINSTEKEEILQEVPLIPNSQYDWEYEQIFKKRSWFSRNKSLSLAVIIITISAVTIYYFVSKENSKSSKENINESQIQNSLTKEKEINSLNYIITKADQYPYDVNLFKEGELKKRLLTLLGKANFKKFIEYSQVQTPIKIINNKFSLIEGGAAHSFGIYEAVVLIDFELDKITVGLLDNIKVKIFSEVSTNPNSFNPEFYDWYLKAEENAKNNQSL